LLCVSHEFALYGQKTLNLPHKKRITESATALHCSAAPAAAA
jgi:hypothetical protein